MKLVRYGPAGRERPGLVDAAGVVRDLSDHVSDVTPDMLNPATLDRLRRLRTERLPAAAQGGRLGPPLAGVGKIVGIGLNYADHAAEAGLPIPEEPIIFGKAASAICGPCDDIPLPPGAGCLDWEVELAVVIGSPARHVAPEAAMAHVAGYAVFNDVSERSWQFHRGGQWIKGKSGDGFAPLGPWLVTAEEIPDPRQLRLWLAVNGERRQNGSTATMIFPVPELIAYASRFMPLLPGDVIATGTPPGVGFGHKPEPLYLAAGDVMELEVEGLGRQRQRIVG